MTTNAFRHRPPEQCTLSKEDQQHILRISNNDQELLDELMAIQGRVSGEPSSLIAFFGIP